MFCIKICCLEPEPVGAELLQVEPEPKKISGAGAEEKWFGSATLGTSNQICIRIWALIYDSAKISSPIQSECILYSISIIIVGHNGS